MSLFDQLGRPAQSMPQQPDPMRMMQSLRSDPAAFLKSRGYTIPEGMRDPGQITRHLLQSGQVGGQRYQQAMRMLQGMRR